MHDHPILDDPQVAAFLAYVERSLAVRRRGRDRPSEEVLNGAKKVIDHLMNDSSNARSS